MAKQKSNKKTKLDIYSIICTKAGMTYGQLQTYRYQHNGEFPDNVKLLAENLLKEYV